MLKMKPSYQQQKNGWNWDLYTILVGGIKDFLMSNLQSPSPNGKNSLVTM